MAKQDEIKKPKALVKSFQMVVGVDLIGSKMSMSASKNIELIDTGNAVVAYSKNTNRIIKIPYTNIKGIELLPEVAE